MARTTSTSSTSDTPDTTTGDAQVEVSDSGVDMSTLTESQKAVLDFKPVDMVRGDKTVTARTQAQLVSLKFDGYVAKS